MDICERFKEFRDRGRLVVYFPNTHAGEEPEAYAVFLALMRVRMGLMVLAPDQEERYEPIYREAIKYHLQTIRHSRLFTSFVPIKTRVYFVETAAVRDAFYGCADFCVPGGSLVGGAVDLASPIQADCPIVLGPAANDGASKALVAAGGALQADSIAAIPELAKTWLSDPQAARDAARKARDWWQNR